MLKNRGIVFKLVGLTLCGISLIFAAVSGYHYFLTSHMIVQKIEENARLLTRNTASRIDAVLRNAENVPENLSRILEYYPAREGDLDAAISAAIMENQALFGVCIAYEPYAHDPSQRLSAPYLYQSNKGVVITELSYDYFLWDWYRLPRDIGRPVWSEPYFDEGGGNIMMATYSRPFYGSSRTGRTLKGIVTADISLSWLQELVSSIQIGKSGYGFLITRKGTFITHPSADLVMTRTLFDLADYASDDSLMEIAIDMTRGNSGFVSMDRFMDRTSCWMAYTPLESSGWSIGVVFPKEELMADVSRLNRMVVLLYLAGICLMAFAVVWISRSITRPLSTLSRMTDGIAAGNLEMILPEPRYNDEVGKLSASFNAMQQSLKQHIRELTQTTAARERIESELKIARDIQMGILPKIFPAFPERTEFDLYATIVPAREVGGDLYDFFFLDQDRLCLVVGDVSGKGIPAALFMAVTCTLIKAKTTHLLSAHEILTRVNEDLSMDNPSMMFVTLFLGILNIKTGEFEYANGGHNPPCRIDGRNQQVTPLETTRGIALGVMPGHVYQSGKMTLIPGDTLFLYTDGVTEAVNPADALFSEKRLIELLSKEKDPSMEQMIRRIMQAVEIFSETAPQADDITMIAVRYQANADPSASDKASDTGACFNGIT